MEAEVLTRQAGFFLSSLTTISLAVLSIEFILDYKLSFFPFSFIIVLYLAGLYLRNRFWRKAWKNDRKILFRYAYIIIWILGIVLLLIFFYFGNSQIIIYTLSHYPAYLGTLTFLFIAYVLLLVFVRRAGF